MINAILSFLAKGRRRSRHNNLMFCEDSPELESCFELTSKRNYWHLTGPHLPIWKFPYSNHPFKKIIKLNTLLLQLTFILWYIQLKTFKRLLRDWFTINELYIWMYFIQVNQKESYIFFNLYHLFAKRVKFAESGLSKPRLPMSFGLVTSQANQLIFLLSFRPPHKKSRSNTFKHVNDFFGSTKREKYNVGLLRTN